ncbi:MAG: DUF4145 domain-containing protein, partial [Pseudomonas sp.]
MISNFQFLRADWPELFRDACCAERLARVDPRAACFYARRTLELAVKWLYDAERSLKTPYKDDLNARLHEPTFKNLVGAALLAKMNIIRKLGNHAVHGNRVVPENDSVAAVRELFHVAFWLGWTYSRTEASRPATTLRFDDVLLPQRQPSTPPAQPRVELLRLAEQLASQDAELTTERKRSSTLQEQIEALQAEVAAAKAANQARPDTHDYDEQHTRDHYIDLLLHEAGWPLDGENDREVEVTGMPNPSGKGYIDYVLWGCDGLPLAVVEAKRAQRSPQEGQQQAKLYAD